MKLRLRPRRTSWELLEIEAAASGGYTLTYRTPEGVKDVKARAVALTVPAYTAADLVRRDCPDASLALKSLDYPPVAAVTIAYPMSAIQQDRLNQAGELPGSCLAASPCACACVGSILS